MKDGDNGRSRGCARQGEARRPYARQGVKAYCSNCNAIIGFTGAIRRGLGRTRSGGTFEGDEMMKPRTKIRLGDVGVPLTVGDLGGLD
jgi:hypothetical protein